MKRLLVLMLLAVLIRQDAGGAPVRQRPWEDEIVYVIVVGKFFDADASNNLMLRRFGAASSEYHGGFQGGDVMGIVQKLDYFQSLGVTTLMLYPIVQNDEQPFGKWLATGYRPQDYFHVDRNFGDIGTLKKLIDEAHHRDMRVILDLPLGMPGLEHPWYNDRSKAALFGKPTMYGVKQWNTDNKEAADYLIRMGRFWKQQSGCDGFRLDSAQLHPPAFWKRFADAMKDRGKDSDFFLLGELPLPPEQIQQSMNQCGFDSAYDFSAGVVRDVFGMDRSIDQIAFVQGEAHRIYRSPRRLVAQIDNYEDPTFLSQAAPDKEARMKLAMTYLLTLDRIPLIFSGDEVAMDYRDAGELFHSDPKESSFFAGIQKLIALRKSSPAIRRGEFEQLVAKDSVYVFSRTSEQECMVVVLNKSNGRVPVRFTLGKMAWRDVKLCDAVSGIVVKNSEDDQPMDAEPFAARVFRVESNVFQKSNPSRSAE